jgi:acyl dehydratase
MSDDQPAQGGAAKRALWFEDFAPGQIYRSGSGPVSAADQASFCSALGVDADDASDQYALLGGWYSTSCTMRLLLTGELSVAGGLIGLGIEQLEWGVLVNPDDTLRVETEVTNVRELRSRPSLGIVSLRSLTFNQTDEIVQDFTHNLLVPKRTI